MLPELGKLVTAQEFWASFKQLVAKGGIHGGPTLGVKWRTKRMLSARIEYHDGRQERGLLPTLAKDWGLLERREFFGFDTVFFRGQVRKRSWSAPAEVIAVVEHENNPYSAHSEIYKLTRFAAPLRVLITYPPNGVLAKRLLREYTDLIHGAVAAGNYAAGACLVILGLPRRWEAYVYDGPRQEFVDLPPLRIQGAYGLSARDFL